MKISTKGRYAMRLMVDIAEHSSEGNVSMKDVAAREGISLKYLEQIVNYLVKIGYLKSYRGPQGGYRLSKNPSEYTVGDILRITEGSMAPVSCLEAETNECPRAADCPTLKVWKGLYSTINEYIDSITLADLINDNLGN